MRYIKGLDTLRAFAVFFVIIQHTGVWFDERVLNGRFIKNVLIPDGGFGVDLFFVLSGFLITTILLRQRGSGERSSVIRDFFVRRALRIFPIYFLLILSLYVINYPDIRAGIFYYLTYTTNILCYKANKWTAFSHAWSLAVEEQFYLLWPWFIIFISPKYLRHLFTAAILIGIASTWCSLNIRGHMAPLLVFNCFDAFGIGGLMAYTITNDNDSKRFKQRLNWLSLIALCIYLYWKIATFFQIDVYGIALCKTVNSILAAWLIYKVVHVRPSLFRRYFLENTVLTFVGKISYGIYLYHYVYNVLVHAQLDAYLKRITADHHELNELVRNVNFYFWLHFVLIVLFSACSWYAIERPFLKLKKYFSYKKESRANVVQQRAEESLVNMN